jgi:hypothetical protein
MYKEAVKSSALICLRVNTTLKTGLKLLEALKKNPKRLNAARYVLTDVLK